MTVFPKLPVLEAIAASLGRSNAECLRNVVLVCSQHILETTGSLVEALLSCGANPQHVFVLGKHYSTNATVAEKLTMLGITVILGSQPNSPGYHDRAMTSDVHLLWQKVLERCQGLRGYQLVVVDDGAHCLKAVPNVFRNMWTITAVEQTTSGLATYSSETTPCPLVAVAACAIKREIEPYQIADEILRRTEDKLGRTCATMQCGVLGLGSIGAALARSLVERGATVNSFDRSDRTVGRVASKGCFEEVLLASDVVFGCTGNVDCFPVAADLSDVRGERILASCSSSDFEFRELLRQRAPQAIEAGVCPTLAVRWSSDLTLMILRSGFPVNFDNSPESVPGERIQLTRGLLLAGILQAALVASRCGDVQPELLMLDPEWQSVALRAWTATGSMKFQNSDHLHNISWLAQHSRGKRLSRSAMNLEANRD